MDGFTRLARDFKARFRDLTLSIRRCTMPKCKFADCSRMPDGSYLIRISQDVDAAAQQLLLIHELAHALSWDTDTHHTDHGPKFGIAYARVWRTFLELLEKQE